MFTSDIMNPWRTTDCKQIGQQEHEIDELVDEKHVPTLFDVARIIPCRNSEDHFPRDERYARVIRDPAKDVDTAANITLSEPVSNVVPGCDENQSKFFYAKVFPGRRLTMPRPPFSGPIMEVQ